MHVHIRKHIYIYVYKTGRGGLIDRALVSHAGDRGFKTRRVKPMTYKIDTCHYLAWCAPVLG